VKSAEHRRGVAAMISIIHPEIRNAQLAGEQ